MDKNETLLEMIKLYFSEWTTRYDRFWKHFIQYSIISYTAILFPVMPLMSVASNIFAKCGQLIFPLVGLFFAFIAFFINVSEAAKIARAYYTFEELIGGLEKNPEKPDLGYGRLAWRAKKADGNENTVYGKLGGFPTKGFLVCMGRFKQMNYLLSFVNLSLQIATALFVVMIY